LIARLFQAVSGSFPSSPAGLAHQGRSQAARRSMGLLGTTILRSQIENPAHGLDDKGRLIGFSSVQ
jgi:hypothetical protein